MGVCSAGRQERPQTGNRQRGVTLLELVVVVCIASVVGFVALGFYHKLLVDVERTTLEQNLGIIQSAVAMKFVALYAAGDEAGIKQLAHNNPIHLLEETPQGYLGELEDPALEALATGSWHYDTKTRRLVYLVRNGEFFVTELPGPGRAEFYLTGTEEEHTNVPRLQSVAPYIWRSPWE